MRDLLAKWLRGGRRDATAHTEVDEPPEDARAVFSDIYRRRAWVSPTADRELYSGPGSDEAFARPYAERVRWFAAEHGLKTIVDLGCGDFRVGQLIAGPPFDYVGVDVVDDVIDYNQRHYQREGVRFLRGDITRDDLPDGDLCLVREVFQHLSNRQISAALVKMRKYRWRLVSDREPSAAAALHPNLDRPQGAESRTDLVSALRFDRPPFNEPNVELVMEIPAPTRMLPQSTIKTFLITG